MELNQLYTAMMDTIGWSVNEQGEVVDPFDNKVVTIKGQKLVLPTKENLSANVEKTIRFHPLMENQSAGESVVMNRYRKQAASYINAAAADLIEKLLTLVGSDNLHAKIHPDHAGVVTEIGHVKESTMLEFGKIIDAVAKAGEEERFLVKLFIKKNGNIGKQAYKRVGVVSFPLYEALVNNEDPYGVTLGKRNRAILMKALTYIFPNIAEPHAYSHGSNSTLAPTVDAIMGAIDKVFGAISAKQRVFGQMDLGDLFKDQLVYVNRWAEAFGDIDQLVGEARKVPAQPGNEGNVVSAGGTVDVSGVPVKVCGGDAAMTQTVTTTPQVTTAPQVVQTQPIQPTGNPVMQHQPVQQPQQQPTPTVGVPYGEILRRRQEMGVFGNAIGKQYPQAVAEQQQAMYMAQQRAFNPMYANHSNPYANQNMLGNPGMQPAIHTNPYNGGGGGQPY